MNSKSMECNYFWIRTYDYNHERDNFDKGILLDEFYLRDISGGREEAKIIVKKRYSGQSAEKLMFAKPKKKTNGIYSIIMDSNKFFYDMFYATIDTFCFWHNCHKPIKGKLRDFPRAFIGEERSYEHDITNPKETAYFCSNDCRANFYYSLKPQSEGEFQIKQEGQKGNIFGYIYLIYNRHNDLYYIGQTRYMPFFRWQEHIKANRVGDINNLSFSVIAEVHKNNNLSEEQNQQYLNSLESWWIEKYREDRYRVANISTPKITIEYLKERFEEIVQRNRQLKLII